jgi:hypothetical protein
LGGFKGALRGKLYAISQRDTKRGGDSDLDTKSAILGVGSWEGRDGAKGGSSEEGFEGNHSRISGD